MSNSREKAHPHPGPPPQAGEGGKVRETVFAHSGHV